MSCWGNQNFVDQISYLKRMAAKGGPEPAEYGELSQCFSKLGDMVRKGLITYEQFPLAWNELHEVFLSSDTPCTFGKLISKVLIAMMLLFAIGCSRTLYGIPEQEWLKLTDEQKTAAINGYNEREQLREQTRAAEAERRAQLQAQKAEEQKQQQEIERRRIEAIYAGEAGNLGDLIRVSIQGGDMLFGNRRRPFQPVSFKLASGESRIVEVISNDQNYNDAVKLAVSYRDGLLLIDEADFRSDLAARIAYDSSWKRGNFYNINSRGYRELRNVCVNVEVIQHLPQY